MAFRKEAFSYAWHGSGRKWDSPLLQVAGGAIGGFLIWLWGLKVPSEILDNPALSGIAAIFIGAAVGALVAFTLRLCWWPFHIRLAPYGGLSSFLKQSLGKQMWPVILMLSGLLSFVLLFSAGMIWFILTVWAPSKAVAANRAEQAVERKDPPLTFQQQQFALDLRRYALSTLNEAWTAAFRVEIALMSAYDAQSVPANKSHPLSMFFRGMTVTGVEADYEDLASMAKSEPSTLGYIETMQWKLKKFLQSYHAFQDYLRIYQEATGIDPNAKGLLSVWLEADARALIGLRDLRASPAVTELQKVGDDVMVSGNHDFDKFLLR
jgi:hypothetical protein